MLYPAELRGRAGSRIGAGARPINSRRCGGRPATAKARPERLLRRATSPAGARRCHGLARLDLAIVHGAGGFRELLANPARILEHLGLDRGEASERIVVPFAERAGPSGLGDIGRTDRPDIAPGRQSAALHNRRLIRTRLRRSRRRRGTEDRRRSLGHRLGDRTAVVKRRYSRAHVGNPRPGRFRQSRRPSPRPCRAALAPRIDDE